MSALIGDVRFAVRQLVRQPLYGTMIVVLMTLGVAGNAAVFRVFNGLFLRPLPFENPELLVDLDETAPSWDLEFVSIAYPDFVTWRAGNRSFQAMTVFDTGGLNLSGDGSSERIDYIAATHDADEVLRLQPVIGRFFNEQEDVPDGARVALLSLGFWEQRFARDPDVLGRTVSLNGLEWEVVGVMPPEARFVGDADIWMPLQGEETQGGNWSLAGMGRLRDGVTVEQAREDLLALHKGAIEQWPVNEITSPVVNDLRARYLGDYRLGSGFLMAAVAIVLLIACANIAGLMFARSLAREAEMRIRVAMGAPRLRILRQLLTESLVLAGVGATMGTVLGVWGSSALVAPMADQFPSWITFDLDMRFLAFTLAVTGGAAVLFGLAPALQGSRRGGTVPSGERSTASAGKRRATSLLVTGEVALALVLLVLGGLSVLDASRLGRVDPGFGTEDIVTYSLALPATRYEDREARLAFAESYVARLRTIPGVTGASIASTLPLAGHWGQFFHAEGAPPLGEDEGTPVVLNRVVSPGYFETMGVELKAGRVFDEFDGREEGSLAVIVNETFVRTHLVAGVDPIGQRIANGTGPGENDIWITVVGVTKDVKHYGMDEEMRPGLYQPVAQSPLNTFQVALHAGVGTETIVGAVRAATAEMDAELPLYSVATMKEVFDEALWTKRATSWLMGAFSAVALLLSIAGIYGVISYSVGQRAKEISVRMAMGAQNAQVLKEVVRQGMGMVLLGVILGLSGALAAAGFMSGILVEVSPRDPAIYTGVTVLILSVAALANYLPARRAAALNPISALRGE